MKKKQITWVDGAEQQNFILKNQYLHRHQNSDLPAQLPAHKYNQPIGGVKQWHRIIVQILNIKLLPVSVKKYHKASTQQKCVTERKSVPSMHEMSIPFKTNLGKITFLDHLKGHHT